MMHFLMYLPYSTIILNYFLKVQTLKVNFFVQLFK